jgi:hypothetical protein
MVSTRENPVKARIRVWLNSFGPAVKYLTPVPGPFGKTAGDPDFVISFCGLFVAIEAKGRGKKATKLQLQRHAELRASGALVFVVDNPKVQLPVIERGLIYRARLYRLAVESGACDVKPNHSGSAG